MRAKQYRTFIAMISIAIALSPCWYRSSALGANVRETGIILVDDLDVQTEPGKHGFLQKRLKKGTRVKIIRHHYGWLQILHGGEVGFIRDDAQIVRIIRKAKSRTKKEKEKGKQVAGPDKQRQTLKREVGEIQRKIETGKAKIQKYSQKEIDTINRLNALEYELHNSRKQLSMQKSAIAQLDRKITATANSSEDLKQQIQAYEQYFSKRLVALYKLGRIGQLNVLASADSIHEFFLRKEALERILTHDEVVRKNLEESRRKLNHMLTELTNQKSDKTARLQVYNEHLRHLTADQSKRKKLLASIRTQKSLELASIASLKESAQKLNQKLSSLGQQHKSEPQAPKTSEKPISAFKGLLNMPVKGKILFLFGPHKNTKFNITNFRSGIGIAAQKGEPVRAVYGGKIVYANWFKGYGNVIIIDHGTNYHTVYAHVEDIFKMTGDVVETGEVIATAGDTGSMSGTTLQFEIRHHGKPLDPMDWLKRG